MFERVITESVLRQLFMKEIPETFLLEEGQMLTPSAAQYLAERGVKVETGRSAAGSIPKADLTRGKGYVNLADGKFHLLKPEHLTHLFGNRLVVKDHPRIVFRGKLDRFQAEILLLQRRAIDAGDLALSRGLGELLARARAIMRADVLGENLSPANLLGLGEDEIRKRTHNPKAFFDLEHLVLNGEMTPWVLMLNRLRTEARSTELAAVAAFSGNSGARRPDIVQALNRLSSVIYLMMLKAARTDKEEAPGINSRRVEETVEKVLADQRTLGPGIPVELSARHVHLSEEHAGQLFGGSLTEARELSQPGQFLCRERVRLIGPGGALENVAVLGPARGNTQIEVSMSDARALGVNPPVRQSGDTAGSAGLRIASDLGTVTVAEGLLIPGRHIHMTQDDAERLGLCDRAMVRVRVGDIRAVVFEEVLVRVNENYRLAMHIDFDEGNACGWKPGTTGSLVQG